MATSACNYYIGIMSGTSLDGIDVALVSINHNKTQFIAAIEVPFEGELREELLNLCLNGQIHLKVLGELTVKLSLAYADAVNQLLIQQDLNANDIIAIGCHGQTVYHSPEGDYPFSMQLINASVLTAQTGITSVSDFRNMDIALGGQGAPLVPPFHHSLVEHLNVKNNSDIAFVNIGGIANISLVGSEQIIGFDTGPGNVLIDSWMQQSFSLNYDDNGALAKQGRVLKPLLKDMLNDDYFSKVGAKSTGREYFNLQWFSYYLDRYNKNNAQANDHDILATLVALTAYSITNTLNHIPSGVVYICGGGAKNCYLVETIRQLLPLCEVTTTAEIDVDPDYVEAMAFAWLAYRCMTNQVANDHNVTGAKKQAILGQITPKSL
ncbi:anhydro-N-acetylmuramic acid kinase [Thalassotalea piscium]